MSTKYNHRKLKNNWTITLHSKNHICLQNNTLMRQLSFIKSYSYTFGLRVITRIVLSFQELVTM